MERGRRQWLSLRRVHIGSPNLQVCKHPSRPTSTASRGNRRGPTTAASWNAVAYRRAVLTVHHHPHHGRNSIWRRRAQHATPPPLRRECYRHRLQGVQPTTSRNLCSSQAVPPRNRWSLASRSLASTYRSRASREQSAHGQSGRGCHPSSLVLEFKKRSYRGNDTSLIRRPTLSQRTQQTTATKAIGNALGWSSALSTRTQKPSGGK